MGQPGCTEKRSRRRGGQETVLCPLLAGGSEGRELPRSVAQQPMQGARAESFPWREPGQRATRAEHHRGSQGRELPTHERSYQRTKGAAHGEAQQPPAHQLFSQPCGSAFLLTLKITWNKFHFCVFPVLSIIVHLI